MKLDRLINEPVSPFADVLFNSAHITSSRAVASKWRELAVGLATYEAGFSWSRSQEPLTEHRVPGECLTMPVRLFTDDLMRIIDDLSS